MASGLSDSFVYRRRPAAAAAAQVMVRVPAFNKDSFDKGNERVQFNIPTGKRGQYLNTRMSYLKFELHTKLAGDPTTANAKRKFPIYALDGGAHSFFRGLQVYHGSNLLENIDQYNALYQLLIDQGFQPGDLGRTITEGIASPTLFAESETREAYLTGIVVNGTAATVTGTVKTEVDLVGPSIKTNLMHRRLGQVITPVGIKAGALKRQATKVPNAVIPHTYDSSIAYPLLGADDFDALASTFVGFDGWNPRVAVNTTGSEATYTFCIPILSGILGGGMSKYLPVGALAADVRLELDLADFDQVRVAIAGIDDTTLVMTKKDISSCIASSTGNEKWTLKNFELCLEYIDVAADVQTAIENATGGEYAVSFDSWSAFTNTIQGGQQAITQLIGTKFSSIKDLTTIFRASAHQTNPLYAGISSRVDPFNNKSLRNAHTNVEHMEVQPYGPGIGWQYLIGATYYPPRIVNSNQESYCEALKTQHNITSLSQPGRMSKADWGVSAFCEEGLYTSGTGDDLLYGRCDEYGTYYITQNLESQPHKSQLQDSGVNTLNQTVYLSMRMPNPFMWPAKLAVDSTSNAVKSSKIDPAGTVNIVTRLPNLQIDTFAHYDAVLLVRNGLLNTRF